MEVLKLLILKSMFSGVSTSVVMTRPALGSGTEGRISYKFVLPYTLSNEKLWRVPSGLVKPMWESPAYSTQRASASLELRGRKRARTVVVDVEGAGVFEDMLSTCSPAEASAIFKAGHKMHRMHSTLHDALKFLEDLHEKAYRTI